mgnify:CR=1 FL=1
MRLPGGRWLFVAAILAVVAGGGLALRWHGEGARVRRAAGESADAFVVTGAPGSSIEGFGGTIGWIYPHETIREEVADLLFDDLGVSVLRVRAFCKNDDPTDEGSLESANDDADPNHFRWEAFDFEGCEKEQALLCQGALKRGTGTFIATAWSPPGWMKENGSRKNGASVREDCFAEFAELWAAYLLGMEKNYGVRFSRVAILNEPDVYPRPYATCQMAPEAYARLCETVAGKFSREKISAGILGPDTSRMESFLGYAEALRGRAAAWERTDALSMHLYHLGRDFYDVDGNRDEWRAFRAFAAAAGKPLWMTEFSNYKDAFSGADPGSAREALAWAHHLHLALTEGNCAAVLWWNLFFDKREESILYAEKSGAKTYEITPKYHTSKNFFRYIRPGMTRLEVLPPAGLPPGNPAASDSGVLVSAYSGAHGRDGTIVALNLSKEPRPLSIRFVSSAAWRPASLNRLRTIAGDAGKVLPAVPVSGGRLVDTLPPQSVTTYTTFPTKEIPANLRGLAKPSGDGARAKPIP